MLYSIWDQADEARTVDEVACHDGLVDGPVGKVDGPVDKMDLRWRKISRGSLHGCLKKWV